MFFFVTRFRSVPEENIPVASTNELLDADLVEF